MKQGCPGELFPGMILVAVSALSMCGWFSWRGIDHPSGAAGAGRGTPGYRPRHGH
jgi:hypothetical protein